MRRAATSILFAITTLALANAFEGTEYQIMQLVGRAVLGGSCEPIRPLMGQDSFFQGHYERCLGMVAGFKSIEAKDAGDSAAVQRLDRVKCEQYKRAITLWQQRPLPTHGSKEDVQSRRNMLASLIDIQKEACTRS